MVSRNFGLPSSFPWPTPRDLKEETYKADVIDYLFGLPEDPALAAAVVKKDEKIGYIHSAQCNLRWVRKNKKLQAEFVELSVRKGKMGNYRRVYDLVPAINRIFHKERTARRRAKERRRLEALKKNDPYFEDRRRKHHQFSLQEFPRDNPFPHILPYRGVRGITLQGNVAELLLHRGWQQQVLYVVTKFCLSGNVDFRNDHHCSILQSHCPKSSLAAIKRTFDRGCLGDYPIFKRGRKGHTYHIVGGASVDEYGLEGRHRVTIPARVLTRVFTNQKMMKHLLAEVVIRVYSRVYHELGKDKPENADRPRLPNHCHRLAQATCNKDGTIGSRRITLIQAMKSQPLYFSSRITKTIDCNRGIHSGVSGQSVLTQTYHRPTYGLYADASAEYLSSILGKSKTWCIRHRQLATQYGFADYVSRWAEFPYKTEKEAQRGYQLYLQSFLNRYHQGGEFFDFNGSEPIQIARVNRSRQNPKTREWENFSWVVRVQCASEYIPFFETKSPGSPTCAALKEIRNQKSPRG